MDDKRQPIQPKPQPKTEEEWYNYSPAMRQYGDLFEQFQDNDNEDTDSSDSKA